MPDVRLFTTEQLSDDMRRAIRALLNDAFAGDFAEDDWQHALGGWHALVLDGESVVAHGALVERRVAVGAREFRAGYVEALAVTPVHQRRGLGTAIMTLLDDVVRARCDLGALSTGEWHFYERLGWERWRGPSYVRDADGRLVRSPDEDEGIMVLRCTASQDIDCEGSITCDERAGDSW